MDKVVLGIGNPGPNYAMTRHNIGFRVVDKLAVLDSIKFRTSRFSSLIAELNIDNKQLLLVKPITYVNLSGEAAQSILNWYKLPPESLMVIADDLSLPLGKLRIRKKGSCGGHHGLESIIQHLNTNEFPRLRIGIGSDNGNSRVSYVLSTFTSEEETIIQNSIQLAAEAVLSWIKNGIEVSMNKYNSQKEKQDQNEN